MFVLKLSGIQKNFFNILHYITIFIDESNKETKKIARLLNLSKQFC